MKVEYRRDLQHSYLVAEPEEKQKVKSYPLMMITENHIPGLLLCSCKRIDENILYYYDVTSRINLSLRCRNRKLEEQDILMVVYGLRKVLVNMEEYLLAGESLNLSPDYIYLDAQMKTVEFCYVPGESWELGKSFRELMEYLLPYINHQSQQGVLVGYGLYHYALEQEFSAESLRLELEKYQKKTEKSAQPEQDYEPDNEEYRIQRRNHEQALDEFFRDDEDEEENHSHPAAVTCGTVIIALYFLAGWYLWKNYAEYLWVWGGSGILAGAGIFIFLRILARKKEAERTASVWKRKPQEEGCMESRYVKEDMGYTGDECENGHYAGEQEECYTQILHPSSEKVSYILEAVMPNQGASIVLPNKELIFFGQLESAVDVVLPSQAVSRMHARIRKEGDVYYICDLNSRNGTRINGKELEGNQEREIKPGDEVNFANVIYQFRKI
jgi:hypothetical protein